jgi:hypothetical protein
LEIPLSAPGALTGHQPYGRRCRAGKPPDHREQRLIDLPTSGLTRQKTSRHSARKPKTGSHKRQLPLSLLLTLILFDFTREGRPTDWDEQLSTHDLAHRDHDPRPHTRLGDLAARLSTTPTHLSPFVQKRLDGRSGHRISNPSASAVVNCRGKSWTSTEDPGLAEALRHLLLFPAHGNK